MPIFRRAFAFNLQHKAIPVRELPETLFAGAFPPTSNPRAAPAFSFFTISYTYIRTRAHMRPKQSERIIYRTPQRRELLRVSALRLTRTIVYCTIVSNCFPTPSSCVSTHYSPYRLPKVAFFLFRAETNAVDLPRCNGTQSCAKPTRFLSFPSPTSSSFPIIEVDFTDTTVLAWKTQQFPEFAYNIPSPSCVYTYLSALSRLRGSRASSRRRYTWSGKVQEFMRSLPEF